MDHPPVAGVGPDLPSERQEDPDPWFIFWFVVAMLVNTYCNLPTQLTHGISVAARCGLSATLFLIGGGLSIEVIRKVGLKPLVLGIILWAVISVASLAVILLL